VGSRTDTLKQAGPSLDPVYKSVLASGIPYTGRPADSRRGRSAGARPRRSRSRRSRCPRRARR
jgi:hypothetical protein